MWRVKKARPKDNKRINYARKARGKCEQQFTHTHTHTFTYSHIHSGAVGQLHLLLTHLLPFFNKRNENVNPCMAFTTQHNFFGYIFSFFFLCPSSHQRLLRLTLTHTRTLKVMLWPHIHTNTYIVILLIRIVGLSETWLISFSQAHFFSVSHTLYLIVGDASVSCLNLLYTVLWWAV